MVELEREILDLYARLDAEIAGLGPQCRSCGECCDFRKETHVLYATSAEAALVAAHAPQPDPWPDRALCPFAIDDGCLNRVYRPLGCRVYYCDPAFSAPSQDLYAKYHDRLKSIIVRHGHAYHYGPFLELLAGGWGV